MGWAIPIAVASLFASGCGSSQSAAAGKGGMAAGEVPCYGPACPPADPGAGSGGEQQGSDDEQNGDAPEVAANPFDPPCPGKVPDWARAGSGAFLHGETRGFYGLGVDAVARGHLERRLASERAAVLALVEVLEAYAAMAGRSYDANSVDRQEQANRVVMTFAARAVEEPPIIGHHFCPGGTALALAYVELDMFFGMLERPENRDNPIHEWLLHNAEGLFDVLSRSRPPS